MVPVDERIPEYCPAGLVEKRRFFSTTFCLVCLLVYVLAIAGVGWMVYWSIFDDVPPNVVSNHGFVRPPSAIVGEKVVAQQYIKKLRQCSGTTSRWLSGECGFHFLGEVPLVLPKNFDGPLFYPFVIPETSMKGRCEFHQTLSFICNPAQWLSPGEYQYPTLHFEVK